VDAACLANGRGYGRFTRELLNAMIVRSPEHEFLLFVDDSAAASVTRAPNVTAVRVRQSEAPTVAAGADAYRRPADMLRFSRAVWRAAPDVFFSPSVYTYFPVPPGLPLVVSIHDAIADRHPDLTLPSRRARLFWRLKVRLAIHQADLILTVSDYAARELQEVLRIPSDVIRIAVEAPASAYRPSESAAQIGAAAVRAGIPAGARWLMYVGGFNPHKRVDRIVRAHARLVAERPDKPVHLVLAGVTEGDVFHGELERIRAAVALAGTGELVHWPGFVPDEELRHLHSGAMALLLPSESEGFGLPAVEAAACGTPVIATTASPLPQLLEGGGIFIPPGDEDALSAALMLLAGNASLCRSLAAGALARASELSWDRAADSAMSALEEAAA
jgi:glycosyltransferase involved in cell wall biosynthesis